MCVHMDGMDKSWCAVCKHGPAEPIGIKPGTPQKPARTFKPKRPVDPFEKLTVEYATGIRCRNCDQLRDPSCQCERDREFVHQATEALNFIAEKGDQFKAPAYLALGSLKRASLRAGNRDRPASGQTAHQEIMSTISVNYGEPDSWRPYRPSGDPLPL